MVGGPITSVAPSTTATALTSIATGLTPGEHGVVGYRVAVDHEVLNILRWTTPGGDARKRIEPAGVPAPPGVLRPAAAASSPRPSSSARASAAPTSPTSASTATGCRPRCSSSCAGRCKAGEPFVYAYYDGIDKVAHEYGLGEHYDAELAGGRPPGGRLLALLPRDAALVITADHGQVDVGDNIVDPAQRRAGPRVVPVGRGPVPLAARPARARADALLEAAQAHHGDTAWVRVARRDRRRGLVGRAGHRRRPPAPGRRRPGGPRPGVVRRPGRHRPVRADRPARLAHRRPRCTSPCS